jgi:putative transposase
LSLLKHVLSSFKSFYYASAIAINLRKPKRGLLFHSDRGSQYTSNRFGKRLKKHSMIASMSGKGACWDNAVGERSMAV